MLNSFVVVFRPYRLLFVSIVAVAESLALWSCAPTDWVTDDMTPASCNDDRRNGTETDIDCGGSECKKCVIDNACLTGSDCASGECTRGTCQEPHCSNLAEDQDEEGVDCGGKDCPSCAASEACANKLKDENETDIDCGGPSDCARCPIGDSCESDEDCLSDRCVYSVCQDDGTGVGGASPAGSSGSGGVSSESGGDGAFAGAPSAGAGGTAETGGSENTGGRTSTGGAAAGEGGTGAPSTGGSEASTGAGGSGGTTTDGSGGTTGGAGGSTGGTGGSTGGTGGSTGGTGGSTGGTGGSTGGTGTCSHTPISGNGLITNFSEFTLGTSWTSGELPWGDADLSGTTRHYGTAGVTLTATITSEGSLNLTGTVPRLRYVGLALDFETCSDASAFTGISVTTQGSTGDCSFFLQLETSRNMPNDDSDGQCEYTSDATKWEDCGYNYTAITDLTETPMVFDFSWSQFTDGMPITPVDETELLGLQFQFEGSTTSDCTFDVTIATIRFMTP